MADQKSAVSFDDIINAERTRKKNETLASEIFGRNKQNKDAFGRNERNSARPPTHPGRMGITKRSSSTASANSGKNPFSPPSRPSSVKAQHARNSRLATAAETDLAVNAAPKGPKGSGFTIKGRSGPSIVEATNFAPGTTAADIEAAINEAELTSCKITSAHPVVKAELQFTTRAAADRVISTFHNMEADFRILKFYHKKRGNSPQPATQPQATTTRDTYDHEQPIAHDMEEDIEMAVEDPLPSQPITTTTVDYESDRERDSSRHLADTSMSDNRYLSDKTEDKNGGRREEPRDRDRDPDRDRRYDDRNYERRDDRDRDRNRERDRDRESHRDRERDRPRDHDREPRGSYHRSDNSYQHANRGSRPSHYGNGVGGGPPPQQQQPPLQRGGPGMGGGGGRMYSDDMMRGGGRGGRGGGGRGGGFRGGYRGYG